MQNQKKTTTSQGMGRHAYIAIATNPAAIPADRRIAELMAQRESDPTDGREVVRTPDGATVVMER